MGLGVRRYYRVQIEADASSNGQLLQRIEGTEMVEYEYDSLNRLQSAAGTISEGRTALRVAITPTTPAAT